jgi:hypothetical protein
LVIQNDMGFTHPREKTARHQAPLFIFFHDVRAEKAEWVTILRLHQGLDIAVKLADYLGLSR